MEEDDLVVGITFLHLAAEAAVVAVADMRGVETQRRHDLKAKAATALHEAGALPDDLGPDLRALNELRKAVTYEGEDVALSADELNALAKRVGAERVAVTGSTARGRRTPISDLDFLVVGRRPRLDDLTLEVDLRALSADQLMVRLRDGDEYVQWVLRFGCILDDQGILREASRVLLETELWPDPERKRRHARTLADLAMRILASDDRDAAEEAARASLTAVAHWILLSNRVFPLSRDELSDQILELGSFDLAAALHRSIHDEPELDELAAMLRLARHALDLTPRRARKVTLPAAA